MMSTTQGFAELRASFLAQEEKSFPFPAISKQVATDTSTFSTALQVVYYPGIAKSAKNALHLTLISKFSSSNVTLRILDSISLQTEFPQLHPPQRAYAVHLEMLEVCE